MEGRGKGLFHAFTVAPPPRPPPRAENCSTRHRVRKTLLTTYFFFFCDEKIVSARPRHQLHLRSVDDVARRAFAFGVGPCDPQRACRASCVLETSVVSTRINA
jgi:hypothetical protein